MKFSSKKHLHVLSLIVIGFIFLVATFFIVRGQMISVQNGAPPSSNHVRSKIFTSSTNHFRIDLSGLSYDKINESYNEVSILTSSGSIQIGEIGTNFNTVEGYLDDLALKNKIIASARENILINGYPSIKTILRFPVSKSLDQLSYFIYPANWVVYTLSTDSKVLYGDLDQIAHSFQYLP